MEKVFSFLVLAFIIATSGISKSPSKAQNENVLLKIGAYDIANIAVYEIIPKFKFLLSTIPDSVWKFYEMQYDSVVLAKKIDDSFKNFFESDDAKDYEFLADEIMKDYQTTEIPRFEYFQNKLDSLRISLQRLDSLAKLLKVEFTFDTFNPEFIVADSSYKDLLVDLTITNEDSQDTFNVKFDQLANFYRYFSDSVLKRIPNYPAINDSLVQSMMDVAKRFQHFGDSLYRSFRRLKLNKSFFDSLFQVELNKLGELFSGSIDYLENFTKLWHLFEEYLKMTYKIWNEYLQMYDNFWREYAKENEKNRKNLEKKYQKKLKEFEMKFKQLENEYRKHFQQLEKEYRNFEKKFKNGTLLNEKVRTFDYQRLKTLMGKHYKFVNSLIAMKKQIEMEILKDLQEKGYINVEVPQN